MGLENLIVNEDNTIIDVWKIINQNVFNMVFVTDSKKKLVGTLSDGDIRRYLLEKENLNALAKNIMNKDYVWAYIDEPKENLLKKITEEINLLPLVNKNFEIVDYFQYKMSFHVPIAIPNLGGNEYKYLMDAFLSTWISSKGNYINAFENEFSKYCQARHGVAVSNGTVALHLALVALGVGRGDEVIVPDLTFAATINAVLHAGATPVIVDVEKESWCISPEEIEKAITPRTKAIIPVHLYGQPCDMEKIMELAVKKSLRVIEDCAEAHGAEFKGKKVGSFGDINCFSFFANKVITTGEGGMCITNDKKLADIMRILRDHGMSTEKKYWHECVGFNYRMTNLQAAIGLAQLERIDKILEEKEKLENLYKKALKNSKDIIFQHNNLKDRKKITWMISVLYKGDREKLMHNFINHKMEARPFFYPLSEMPIYKDYVFSAKNSKEISKMGINFPTNKIVNLELIDKINEYVM